MAEITKHGEKRVRSRGGKNKKTAKKTADIAHEEGLPATHYKGRFRRYLDKQQITHGSQVKVHAGMLYFFKGDVLITCYTVPGQFKKYLKY